MGSSLSDYLKKQQALAAEAEARAKAEAEAKERAEAELKERLAAEAKAQAEAEEKERLAAEALAREQNARKTLRSKSEDTAPGFDFSSESKTSLLQDEQEDEEEFQGAVTLVGVGLPPEVLAKSNKPELSLVRPQSSEKSDDESFVIEEQEKTVIAPPISSPSTPSAPQPSLSAEEAAQVFAEAQKDYVPAGLMKRATASLIDLAVVQMIMLAFAFSLVEQLPELDDSFFMERSTPEVLTYFGSIVLAAFALYAIVTIIYFGWFYRNRGATPGKLAMKLRVVDERTGGYPGYGATFLREVLAKLVSALPLFLGYVQAAFNADQKALHDILAETRVVHIRPRRKKKKKGRV